MKKILFAVLAVLLLVCAYAESEDLTATYKEKYEETVAFKAIKTMARYLSDDLSLDQSVMSFQRDSVAWDYMSHFDRGYFSSVKSRSYTDFRSENWVVKSETEFSCDVYMLLTVTFNTNNVVYEFPCGYHFDFKRTGIENDFWQAYDFYCLPDSADMSTAARLTESYEGISVYAVVGKSYKGFMLVLDDPSRLFVGTIDWFGSSAEGLRINKLTEKYDALVAINGGGFSDNGGKGNGGTPYGLIIANGVTKHAHESGNTLCNTIMGFDYDNVLHVGNYTYSELQELNLRDAMAFHPALIIDSETVKIRKNGSTPYAPP